MIQSNDIEYIKYGLFLLRSYTASENNDNIQNILNLNILETFLHILKNTGDINIIVSYNPLIISLRYYG
jgi:hypothetical protein